jgi:hypothetical protein
MNTNRQRFQALAAKCIERIEAQGVRGDKRQADAALHFYCGAASVLTDHHDDEFRKPLELWIALILCVRGMTAVRMHAAGHFDK